MFIGTLLGEGKLERELSRGVAGKALKRGAGDGGVKEAEEFSTERTSWRLVE
jgi:hypothetical protein